MTDDVGIAVVDGKDALAYVIIRPTERGVEVEAASQGLTREEAATILREVADRWDAQ